MWYFSSSSRVLRGTLSDTCFPLFLFFLVHSVLALSLSLSFLPSLLMHLPLFSRLLLPFSGLITIYTCINCKLWYVNTFSGRCGIINPCTMILQLLLVYHCVYQLLLSIVLAHTVHDDEFVILLLSCYVCFHWNWDEKPWAIVIKLTFSVPGVPVFALSLSFSFSIVFVFCNVFFAK